MDSDSENSKGHAIQLLEFETFLKFDLDALDNYIKSADEEILVVTVIGNTDSNLNELTNLMIDTPDCFNTTNTGIWLYSNLLKHNSPHIKILILNVPGVEREKFNEKIYTMLHAISSIIILHTTKPTLSDLEILTKVPRVLTGTNNPEEILLELSPKFFFVFRKESPLEDNSFYSHLPQVSEDPIALLEYLEKEDEMREFFVRLYKERKAFILGQNIDKKEISDLMKAITVNSFCKSYKGKKNNGITLSKLLIEFVNSINQKLSFNLNKM